MKKGRICRANRLIKAGCMAFCLVLVTTVIRCQQTVPANRIHLLGKVVDAQNSKPMASAAVSIRTKADSTETVHLVCNQSGEFSAEIIQGDYIVQASYNGYSPLISLRAVAAVPDKSALSWHRDH